MRKWVSSKTDQLLSNDAWLYFAVLLAYAYVFMQMSLQLGWQIYFSWILSLSILSIPVFIYVVLKDKLLITTLYRNLLAISVFITYPILLIVFIIDVGTFGFAKYLLTTDLAEFEIYAFLAILYIMLEVALRFLESRKQKRSLPSFEKISMFKLALICVSIFCFFILSLSEFYRIRVGDKSMVDKLFYFMFSWAQLIIIYSSYYVYYYIHHRFIFNRLFKEKGILHYIAALGMLVLLLAPIQNSLIQFFPVVDQLKLHPTGLVPQVFDDFNFGLPLFVLVLSLPLIIVIEWYKQANALSTLQVEKSTSELNLLKQQINPHFFFNTLNNLYSMSLTNEEETPETILKLSDLMRYVIYKGKEDKVLLSEEIQYIKDYVDLQMIRIHQNIDFKLELDIKNTDVLVSPLLFIIFVENAFKHGIEPAGNPSILYIRFSDTQDTLTFKCVNSFEDEESSNGEGIGLKNLKQRLNISYKNRHLLTLKQIDNRYSATLVLKHEQ